MAIGRKLRAHFIVHEAFEGMGAYLTWAQAQNMDITYSRVYQGEVLPTTVDSIDFLFIMGGPQSPETSLAQCHYFDAPAEKALIRLAMEQQKVVIGVCLGAQLIGSALGAVHGKSPEPEIGNFPIQLSEKGENPPLLAHFGQNLVVGHWHNDMAGLPEGATVLASSAGCPRQIIEFGPLCYGLQCHLEFNLAIVKDLIAHSQDTWQVDQLPPFVDSQAAILSYDYQDMNEKLFVFLNGLKAQYLG